FLVGWGMATATYPGHSAPASARARIFQNGRALVQSSTQDLGTGTYTIMTQLAAESLGLPLDNVDFELGDSSFPKAPVSGGGMTFGLGMALLEETVPDSKTGVVVNRNLADYRLPVNADVPDIEVDFVERPDPHINSLGVRGLGELPITGAAAAIANAVYHAT